jgi:hypothetical protein
LECFIEVLKECLVVQSSGRGSEFAEAGYRQSVIYDLPQALEREELVETAEIFGESRNQIINNKLQASPILILLPIKHLSNIYPPYFIQAHGIARASDDGRQVLETGAVEFRRGRSASGRRIPSLLQITHNSAVWLP